MRRALLLALLLSCGKQSRTVAMHAQNNSGQDGTATFVELADGKIDVTEVLEASTFPGPQSSHVHAGHCDDLREIQFVIFVLGSDAGINEPFSMDGGTVTFHNVISPNGGWDGIFDGDHAINAHDPRDNTLYVSCGDLQ